MENGAAAPPLRSGLPSTIDHSPSVYYPSGMTQNEATLDPDKAAKRDRIRSSLALVKTEIETSKAKLDSAHERRRALILLGLEGAPKGENLLSYDELAEVTTLTRSAVYKIVRNGFKDAPLSEQRSAAAV